MNLDSRQLMQVNRVDRYDENNRNIFLILFSDLFV